MGYTAVLKVDKSVLIYSLLEGIFLAKEIFGYARVSTREQNLERQLFELRKFVPEKNIFSDKRSGKDFDRTEYKKMKMVVREGDEIYIKSLDRLGRNKRLIKEELQWFRDKRVLVRIIDFPQTMIDAVDERQRDILDLVTTILVEVLAYLAEEERKTIHARQAEGIAVWRRTGITKTGRPYGRPRTEIPPNWNKIYTAWKNKLLKSREAWRLLKISKNTFYRFVREHECKES